MRTSLAWIQPHPRGVILRHMVNSFQITLSIDFENIFLPNNLIIIRNHVNDEEDVGESLRHGGPARASNSKFGSQISNPTQCPGLPCSQIDTQDAYEIGFGNSTYEWKEDKINFLMALVPSPTKITFNHVKIIHPVLYYRYLGSKTTSYVRLGTIYYGSTRMGLGAV
jgi:hypothetical protein